MKLRRFLPLILVALTVAILQSHGSAGDKDKKKDVEIKLKDGKASIDDKLTADDPVHGEVKKKHKAYVLVMEEGKEYRIDMIAKDVDNVPLDPYLYLEDAEGKLVARDDDGGGFPHARISYKSKGGKHRILCTYFGDASMGDYTLKITQADGK